MTNFFFKKKISGHKLGPPLTGSKKTSRVNYVYMHYSGGKVLKGTQDYNT